MLPTEMFSGDAVPQKPWTPNVWTTGPDVLVAQAQQALFQNWGDVTSGALGTTDRAMAGTTPGVENESDQLINGSTPGDAPSGSAGRRGGRSAQWQENLAYLRRDEPLAAWASGQHDGPANPAA
jgi:hypothetical protein